MKKTIEPQKTKEDEKTDGEAGSLCFFLFALFAFLSAKVLSVAAEGRAGLSVVDEKPLSPSHEAPGLADRAIRDFCLIFDF